VKTVKKFEGSARCQAARNGTASAKVARPPAAHSATRTFLSVKEVCERLGVSESTFHRIRDEAWMPRPIALSPQILRWSVTEIDEALRKQAPRPEPGEVPEPAGPAASRLTRTFLAR
jgi:predicted DNA-binding transcriptional regulator AlpA